MLERLKVNKSLSRIEPYSTYSKLNIDVDISDWESDQPSLDSLGWKPV